MLWLLLFCDKSEKTDMINKAIKEIKEKDARYNAVNWVRINIELEASKGHDYHVKDVPCIYAGKDTVYELKDCESYEEVVQKVQSAMDQFLNAAIL